MALRLEFAAHSDIGLRRRENQDRFLVSGELHLFAIADGMGGLPHGSAAAETTLATLERYFRARVPASEADWRTLITIVSREVVALGRRLSPLLGIGSTLTVAHAGPRSLTVAHVGDSAAFRLRGQDWCQLTREHTVGGRALRGRSAADETVPPDADHILTSCIGLLPLEETDVIETDLQPGDRYLLCSDGITKTASSAQIRETLSAAADKPEVAARRLVELANRLGGPDNSTAVVLYASG